MRHRLPPLSRVLAPALVALLATAARATPPAEAASSAEALPAQELPAPSEPPVAGDATQAEALPALAAVCDALFVGLGAGGEALVPVAVAPVTKDDPLARFVADYLVWCLGTRRGVAVLERARLEAIVEELKLDYAMGDATALERLGKLSGARSVATVGVEAVGTERLIAARLVRIEGAEVVVSAPPVRVPDQSLQTLYREVLEEKSRLVAVGLSAGVPGLGQIYVDRPIRGGLIMAVEVGLLGSALALHLQGADDEEAYHRNVPETVGRRQNAMDAYDTRDTLLWVALAVWAVQLADVALTAPPVPSLETRFEMLEGPVGPEVGRR